MLTDQCTVPPTDATLKALSVFSYLLKYVKETNVANHYGVLSTLLASANVAPGVPAYPQVP